MTEPSLLLLIPAYNEEKVIERTVRAALASDYPQVRVVANTTNAGVARGNNQCFAAARGRYVLLLNNDTIVPPGWLPASATICSRSFRF